MGPLENEIFPNTGRGLGTPGPSLVYVSSYNYNIAPPLYASLATSTILLCKKQYFDSTSNSLNDYTSSWIQVYEKILEITKINFCLDIYDLTLSNILFLQL